MNLIEISKIVIPPNRQRSEFSDKKLQELSVSIHNVGLLQPIVLRRDGITLVCGERRLRVLSILKSSYVHDGHTVQPGHAPFVHLGELSPEKIFEAELEENLKRVDLTWQERVRALEQLHKFRLVENPSQTFTDTAREVRDKPDVTGTEITEISNAVLLAGFLDDPIVAACKDEKEARKAIKDEVMRRERKRRMQEVDISSTRHKLYLGDCFNGTPKNTFDCIVTDPPYGIDIHKKDTFDSDRHEYDDSDAYFQTILRELPTLAYRACKQDAHAYVFCDIRRWNDLFVAFELGGWTVWPRPLIWDKGNTGSFGNIEYGFRSCYDAILFARKGDRKVTAGYRDVLNIPQRTDLLHPAGKPAELYAEILKRSCLPGDVVGDFFCGHGPIFKAAEQLSLEAWGWEINEKYYTMAQETLSKTCSK